MNSPYLWLLNCFISGRLQHDDYWAEDVQAFLADRYSELDSERFASVVRMLERRIQRVIYGNYQMRCPRTKFLRQFGLSDTEFLECIRSGRLNMMMELMDGFPKELFLAVMRAGKLEQRSMV